MIQTLATLLSITVNDDDVKQTPAGLAKTPTPSRGRFSYHHILYTGLNDHDIELLSHHFPSVLNYNLISFYRSLNGARLFSGEILLSGFLRSSTRFASTDPIGQPISLDYGNNIDRPSCIGKDHFVVGFIVGQSENATIALNLDLELMLYGETSLVRRRIWSSLEEGIEDIVTSRLNLEGRLI